MREAIMATGYPDRGIIFWPVGTGDSTTIIIDKETFLQVDLRHLEAAGDEDDPRTPVLDQLVKLLPRLPNA